MKHRVVIIGSGFGGLFAAKALQKVDVDVTLIARTTHHLFQPLLYQVATGILSEGEIAPATREILRGQRNVRTLLGDVTNLDLDAKTVTSQVMGRSIATEYDSLIVAAGTNQSYFGNDGFAEHAPGLKTIDDALELRGRIFGAFELAERSDDPEEVRRLLTFVVIGAGPTGVEMAGQIAELAHRTLARDFRSINPRSSRILLVDAVDRILPPFGERLGEKAKSTLEGLGIEVRLGAMVTNVDRMGIEVRERNGTRQRIEASTKVWAAGVAASGLGRQIADQSATQLDRVGRVEVQPDFSVPGRPEVFVIGDMAAMKTSPGVAQFAIQGARHVAKVIECRLHERQTPAPFRYKDKGSMATISRFNAVAMIGPFRFSGFFAWVLWLFIHLLYITGFKSRLTTLFHWLVSFLGRGRSERTITEQQVLGRLALKKQSQSP